MSEIITAVYEKGILRPTRPLSLREHQMVRLQFLAAEPAGEAEEIIALLLAAGQLRRRAVQGAPPPDPEPAKEREELARILGVAPGKPLSQILTENPNHHP